MFDVTDYLARLNDRTDDYELRLDGARVASEMDELRAALPPRYVIVHVPFELAAANGLRHYVVDTETWEAVSKHTTRRGAELDIIDRTEDG